MDKRVKQLIIHIFVTIAIVIASIPLWGLSQAQSGSLLATSFNDIKVDLEYDDFSSLVIVDDDMALELLKPTTLYMRNQNDFEKTYELVLVINKNSSVSYNNLRVSLDDEIIKLKDLNVTSDKDNYYFVLNEYTLDAYSDTSVDARLWLDSTSSDIDLNSTLTTNFITR